MKEYVIFLEVEMEDALLCWIRFLHQGESANQALNALVNEWPRPIVGGGVIRKAEIYAPGDAMRYQLEPKCVQRYRLEHRP